MTIAKEMWDVQGWYTPGCTVDRSLFVLCHDSGLRSVHAHRQAHIHRPCILMLKPCVCQRPSPLLREQAGACAGRVSVWKLLQGCHALRNEMAHLCSRLQAYLMFEVLERAWLDLTHSLKSVGHLDDLIGEAEYPVTCCMPLT